MHQKQSACFSQKKSSEFNYLGLLINSQLSFESHVIKVGHRVKFILSNFGFIRNSMTNDAAKLYVCMLWYCHIIIFIFWIFHTLQSITIHIMLLTKPSVDVNSPQKSITGSISSTKVSRDPIGPHTYTVIYPHKHFLNIVK